MLIVFLIMKTQKLRDMADNSEKEMQNPCPYIKGNMGFGPCRSYKPCDLCDGIEENKRYAGCKTYRDWEDNLQLTNGIDKIEEKPYSE